MRLHLLRHGIAIDREDPRSPAEPDRFLTDKGRRHTRAVAKGLAELGFAPELYVVSPYTRARQTAEIVRDRLDAGVEFVTCDGLLPSTPAEAAASAIAAVLEDRELEDVVCVGHAPNLDELLAYLVGADAAFTELKKSGLASLELASGPVGRGRARLVALFGPAVLRQLGRG